METGWIPAALRQVTRPLTLSLGLLGLGLGELAIAPQAIAIDEIQLTYGVLRLEAIQLRDLERFATTGEAAPDIQALLRFGRIDHALARAILTAEIEVDAEVFNQAANTFVFEAFLQLLGSAMGLPDSPLESWRSLRQALTLSALDNRVSILEVLENLEGTSLIIDVQQALDVAGTVRRDIRDVQGLFESIQATTTVLETPATAEPLPPAPRTPSAAPRDR